MKRDSGYSVNWIVSLPRPFKEARLGGVSGDLRVIFLTAGLCGDKSLCCRFVDYPLSRFVPNGRARSPNAPLTTSD